jgi:DNA-binding beta-propeller fold protein YncE
MVAVLPIAPASMAAPMRQASTRMPLVEGKARWTATTEPIEAPISAAFDPNGVLWVLEGGSQPRLIPVRREGLGDVLQPSEFVGPTRIAAGRDGTLLVSDPDAGSVHRLVIDGESAVVEQAFTTDENDLEPIAAAETADGFALVDRRRGDVVILDERGRVRRRVGSPEISGGWGDPIDLAVAPNGRIYVADRDRHRIVVLAADGSFLSAFGDRGPFPGLFVEPFAVEIVGDRVLVTDRLNHRIAIHTLDGDPAGHWGMHAVIPRQGEGRIHYPVDLAVSSDGAIAAVIEPFERRVQWFEGDASVESIAAQAELPSLDGVLSHFGPGIASDGDLVALWEPETASVVVFDWRGTLPIHVTTFGGPGVAPDRLGRTTAIAIDAESQRVAMADAANRRIAFVDLARDRAAPLRFDPFMGRTAGTVSLSRVRAGAEAISSPDRFSQPIEPRGLAWLPNGSLAILDGANGAVIVLATAPSSHAGSRPLPSEVVSVWGARGSEGVPFDEATAIAISPRGDALAVLDGGASRIVQIGLDGTAGPEVSIDPAIGRIAAGLAWTEHGFALSDPQRDALLLLDEAGSSTRRSLGGRGVADGRLWLPAGLAMREDGVVLVVDQGNHRVQGFDSKDGAWQVVFSLGRASNRQRPGGNE